MLFNEAKHEIPLPLKFVMQLPLTTCGAHCLMMGIRSYIFRGMVMSIPFSLRPNRVRSWPPLSMPSPHLLSIIHRLNA